MSKATVIILLAAYSTCRNDASKIL